MNKPSALLRSVFPDGVFRVEDIDDLAWGSAFLGGGGGGDPYIGSLLLRSAMGRQPQIRLTDLNDLADDAAVSMTALFGSPTVMVEKLPGMAESRRSLEVVESAQGRTSDAVISGEAGGINGLMHLAIAAEMDRPAIDGDLIGRAVPGADMTSLAMNARGASGARPVVAITDELGNACTVSPISSRHAEKLLRSITVAMGSSSVISTGFMSGAVLRAYAIAGTTSIATALGRAVRRARAAKTDMIAALLAALRALPHYNRCGVLFTGKIINFERRTEGGWNKGKVTLAELAGDATMTIEFQNEYLIARHNGKYVGSMPDLISIVETESCNVILAESLRYGQRVTVIGSSVPELIRGSNAIAIMGPQVFGHDVAYEPIEVLNGFA